MSLVVPARLVLPAHGLAGAQDLPISAGLAISAAAAALVVSFVVLSLAWRSPRYGAESGRPVAPSFARLVGSRAWRGLLRLVGLLGLAYLVVVACWGKDLLINPFFGILYVWIWVGMVPASLLAGPVWCAISPWRTLCAGLCRLLRTDPERGLVGYPARLGVWPGALGLLAFVWLELVYPHQTDLTPVRLWCAAYLVVMVVGGTLCGSRFLAGADPFEVYSTLVARLSVWGRRDDGTLVVRSPLANLAATPATPGTAAVVAVLFGSTAYDAFRDSTRWLTFTQTADASTYLLDCLCLLAFCLGVGLILMVASVATVAPGRSWRELPAEFAPSVVPIVVGYVAAHYLSYLVEVGMQTLVLASDPLSNGSNVFGTGDLAVSYWISRHPTLLADVRVLAVVLGHVVGVVAAHERALTLLPARQRVIGQLPLLVAMVGFTVNGLYLLFSS